MEFIFSTNLDLIIGCILKDRRQNLQKEQADVATHLSIQPSTLSKIETGSTKMTVEYVAMLSGIYGIRLSDFFVVLEKCVERLRKEKILVYTPKTAQYIQNEADITRHLSQSAKIGTGLLLSILPLPLLPLKSLANGVTFLLSSDKKSSKNDKKTPSSILELTNDQLSTMLSPLLNDLWHELDEKQEQSIKEY